MNSGRERLSKWYVSYIPFGRSFLSTRRAESSETVIVLFSISLVNNVFNVRVLTYLHLLS